jgi:hypothetical protein
MSRVNPQMFVIKASTDMASDSANSSSACWTSRHVESRNSSIPDNGNSHRAISYSKVLQAIKRMTQMSEDHPFHLDAETAEQSSEILGVLFNNVDIDAPQIFPHEGDTLVLTWQNTMLKRLLSVSPGEVDVIEMLRSSSIRSEAECSFADKEELLPWLLSVAGRPVSSQTGSSQLKDEAVSACSKMI